MATTQQTTAATAITTEPQTVSKRTRRAVEEYMTVLNQNVPEFPYVDVPNSPGLFVVVTPTGTYLVDIIEGTCTCPDMEYRDPAGGCKHVRRVRFAVGAATIPRQAVDNPDIQIDPALGEHVEGTPRTSHKGNPELAEMI